MSVDLLQAVRFQSSCHKGFIAATRMNKTVFSNSSHSPITILILSDMRLFYLKPVHMAQNTSLYAEYKLSIIRDVFSVSFKCSSSVKFPATHSLNLNNCFL